MLGEQTRHVQTGRVRLRAVLIERPVWVVGRVHPLIQDRAFDFQGDVVGIPESHYGRQNETNLILGGRLCGKPHAESEQHAVEYRAIAGLGFFGGRRGTRTDVLAVAG